MSAAVGQRTLFGEVAKRATLRFAVSVAGRRGQWANSVPLVVAEARAAALAGGRPVVLATDGSGVEVRHSAAHGFTVAAAGWAMPPWSEQVQRLLDEHG